MTSKYNAHTSGSQLVRDFSSSIRGKTLLVTGVSPGGIGGFFTTAVANAEPSLIILAGRSESSLDKAAADVGKANPNVKTRNLIIDLGSFKSVRDAAEQVNAWDDVPAIDVLVNNAGIMAVPYGKTEDGFERQFGTNYLGPFLFTNLVVDKVLRSPSPRIVIVSSDGHRLNPIRWTDYNFGDGKHYNKWFAYGQSKTACNLMALSLAAKLGRRGLQAYSLHPGVYMSNLGRDVDWSVDLQGLRDADITMGTRLMHEDLKMKSEDEIIATVVYAAFGDDLEKHNGAYLHDCHVADQYKEEVWPWGKDPIDADRLWMLAEKLVGQEFKY